MDSDNVKMRYSLRSIT